MPAVTSQGVTLQRGDGASPEVFATIADITDFNSPDGELSVIDVTSLDDSYATYIAGLIDEGSVSISGHFIGTDAAQTGLRTDRAAGTLRNFKITLTDSPATVFSFAAFVQTYTTNSSTNDRVAFSATLKVSGQVTES